MFVQQSNKNDDMSFLNITKKIPTPGHHTIRTALDIDGPPKSHKLNKKGPISSSNIFD